MNSDDQDDDPWLRQFQDGAARREARSNATGWGCFTFIVLFVLLITLAAMGTGS